MLEVAEMTEKLLCAGIGCAAQMAPCISCNMLFIKLPMEQHVDCVAGCVVPYNQHEAYCTVQC